MLATFSEFLNQLLGLDHDGTELSASQMGARAVVVFCVAVALARLGARRFLSHNAGFDIMVVVVLGSVLSRAINGQAAFWPTLGASVLLVLLHHLFATLAFHWHWFSMLVKGRPHVLVREGKVDRDAMCHTKITDDDLDENLRLHGNVADMKRVAEARLERNGAVSVIKKSSFTGGRGEGREPGAEG